MDLFFRDYGSGPPLLILHGLLGASGNWHTLSGKLFSQAFHVFTLDLRNHGRSPHSDVFDYPTMASDVEAFMDKHGLETAHVVGHSMGGKAAMYLATTAPDRLGRLVVVDIAPKAYPARHEHILTALQAVHPPDYDDRSAIDAALAEHIDARPIRQFLLKNLTLDSETKTYRWQMNLDALVRNYDRVNEPLPAPAVFDGPTLFVRGERSDYIRDEDRSRITQHFPQARLVTIPGAGHWVHADAPDAFGEAVMDFLSAQEVSGRAG